MFLEVQGINFA